MNYAEFLARKSQLAFEAGFPPVWMPDFLFPFQRYLIDWSLRKGCAAIFADCGMGKGPLSLVWAENVVRHTNRPVLILTPLAVSHQLVREANKFGVEAARSADGKPCRNITVTNYERLDKFNPEDYSGVVCDEASCIKHWTGATQKLVTRFLSKLQYRLLCTATPSPNDFVEMGVLSEALGGLTHSEMLSTFFRQLTDDEKKKRATPQDVVHSKRLSWRVIQSMGQWVLRPHAFEPFWRWVASWARACRKPSDLGPFDDSTFVLPPLNRRDHMVVPRMPPEGWLFTVPAFGLNQERGERRRTLAERSELVADLTKDSDRAIIWCQLNSEGDALEKAIPGSIQVKGSDSNDFKEMAIEWFIGERCICGLNTKHARLGACGKKNTRKTAAKSAKQTPNTPLGFGVNPPAPPMKTESTCEPTIGPTSIDGRKVELLATRSTLRDESDTKPTPTIEPQSKSRSRKHESGTPKLDSPTSSKSTDSRQQATGEFSLSKEDVAPSAEEPTLKTNEGIGGTLTTAMRPSEPVASSAPIAIEASATSATIPTDLSKQQCTCGHRSGRRILISKAKIIGLGMNLQCCAHVVTFVTHSYEQFYQSIRRCWRFGQQRPVILDVIATEGEVNVKRNMDRKEKLGDLMFNSVIGFMNDALAVKSSTDTLETKVPQWLSKTSS